jgi:hypothetical protein
VKELHRRHPSLWNLTIQSGADSLSPASCSRCGCLPLLDGRVRLDGDLDGHDWNSSKRSDGRRGLAGDAPAMPKTGHRVRPEGCGASEQFEDLREGQMTRVR